MALKKKLDRLDLRINAEVKTKIKQASAFVEEDMTEFVMKRIMPDVDRILEAERQIKLSDASWLSFESILFSPKKASPKLKSAIKEYSTRQSK
ncbi:MAG: DUF1778 domain-containing protein [Proteobacteria bacterium]|nr:DUF1778 domain-containing protein [Pseudomonadota bacterium]